MKLTSLLIMLAALLVSLPAVSALNVDTFTRTGVGDFWDFNNDGSGSNSLTINSNELLITDGSNSHNTYTNATIEENGSFSLFRFASKISTTGLQTDIRLKANSGTVAATMRFATGDYYTLSPGQTATNGTYSANVWDVHEVYLNQTSDTFNWYINGVMICNTCGFQNNAPMEQIEIVTQNGASGNIRLDNISFSRNLTGYSVDIYDNNDVPIDNFTIALYDENLTNIANNTESGFGNVGNITNNGNYTLEFIKVGYKTVNTSFEYLGNHTFLHLGSLISPSINISFFDEETKAQLVNTSYKLIFDTFASDNNLTGSSSVFIDLNDTGELEIEYNKNLYHLRSYFMNIDAQTNASVDLYLLNQSAQNVATIQIEATDENGIGLNGAIVKALRRYVSDDNVVTFEVVEMSRTDNDGLAGFHLQQETATYQFVIEYLGNTVLTTGATRIYTSTQTLSATIEEDIIESTVLNVNLEKNLTFNNNTNMFTFYYNDPSSTIEEVCLYIDRIRPSGKVVVNSTCLTANTGTIQLGIGANVTGNYIARAVVDTTTTFSEHLTDYLEVVIDNIAETLGTEGLFWFGGVLTLAVGAIFAFLAGAVAGIVGALIALIFSGMFGLITFGWGTAMFLITMAVVLIIGMSRNRVT